MGASTHNVYRWVVQHRNVGLTVVGFEQLPRWRDIAGFEQSGYIGTLDFGDRRAVGERTQHGHRRGIDRRVRVDEDAELRPDFLGSIRNAEQRLEHRRRIGRSEEHTSELQSLMRISYAVFCLKKKKKH